MIMTGFLAAPAKSVLTRCRIRWYESSNRLIFILLFVPPARARFHSLADTNEIFRKNLHSQLWSSVDRNWLYYSIFHAFSQAVWMNSEATQWNLYESAKTRCVGRCKYFETADWTRNLVHLQLICRYFKNIVLPFTPRKLASLIDSGLYRGDLNWIKKSKSNACIL